MLGVPGIGQTVNGSRIQLRLGPIPFQPGEFSKLLLIIFFAGYLVRKREVLSVVTHRYLGIPFPRARDLGPVVAAWLASLMVLVVVKDLGTSLLYFAIFLVMLYIATERASWLIIGMTMFVVGAYLAYQSFGHVQERVNIWLHPFQADGRRARRTSWCRACSGSRPGACSGPAGAWATGDRAVRQHRLHPLQPR